MAIATGELVPVVKSDEPPEAVPKVETVPVDVAVPVVDVVDAEPPAVPVVDAAAPAVYAPAAAPAVDVPAAAPVVDVPVAAPAVALGLVDRQVASLELTKAEAEEI